MKAKHLLLGAACILSAINFTSCKKTDADEEPASTEAATTLELSGRQAVSDDISEDNNNIFMEAAASAALNGSWSVGGRPLAPVILGGGTITVTPAIGFPKTVVIDFGAGVTGPYGVRRSGIINIVISDSVRKTGSTATMTFNNYYVNKYKIEGTATWKNTTTATEKSWERKIVDGKITDSVGNFWLHTSTKNVVEIAGADTPFILGDDVFSVTGNATVTNSAGRSRTVTILDALIKANSCRHISQGAIKIQGPRHYVTIDYGSGACDNEATISIDGGTATVFILY